MCTRAHSYKHTRAHFLLLEITDEAVAKLRAELEAQVRVVIVIVIVTVWCVMLCCYCRYQASVLVKVSVSSVSGSVTWLSMTAVLVSVSNNFTF